MNNFVLPTWTEAKNEVNNCTGTALDKFIYEQEPAGAAEEPFREGLLAVLTEARLIAFTEAEAALMLLRDYAVRSAPPSEVIGVERALDKIRELKDGKGAE